MNYAAELDAPALSEAGARSLTRTRDSAAQSVYEVRHTDPASFLEDLKADLELGAVADGIVRLAIINGPTTYEQVEAPNYSPNGAKRHPWFRSKYVAASYQARGQLVKLSAYCGYAYSVKDGTPSPFALNRTRECAQQLGSTMRQLQAPLQKLAIQVRGGGVYVEDPSDPWFGAYMASIETPPPVHCQHCGEEIHWSNEAWRHTSTGRAEVTVSAAGKSGRPIKKLDHYAEPPAEEAA